MRAFEDIAQIIIEQCHNEIRQCNIDNISSSKVDKFIFIWVMPSDPKASLKAKFLRTFN